MKTTPHILFSHPAVVLVYCGMAMILVMAFIQPALSAIAFACVAMLGLLVSGVRSFAKRLAWQLPVVAAITLLNCLFVQRGATVLMHVGDFGLHEESLLYGLSMGLALAAAMELFVLLGDIVDADDVLAQFGKHFPSSALLASISMGLIPRMRRNAEERRDALKACTALPSPKGRLASASDEVSVLVANALEDSLVMADSMRVRGYGVNRDRTRYQRRRFAVADGVALACVMGLGALAFAAGVAASASFSFYPRIVHGANPIECMVFAAFFLLPHGAYLIDSAKRRRRTGDARYGC